MIATVYVTKNFGFRRGEIYFADLDPHYGSEQGGKRPVIVIQNNTGNKQKRSYNTSYRTECKYGVKYSRFGLRPGNGNDSAQRYGKRTYGK